MWYIYRSNCGILVASLFYVEKYLNMIIAQGIKKTNSLMYPQPLPRMASILKYLYLKAPKCVFLAILGAGGGGGVYFYHKWELHNDFISSQALIGCAIK